MHACNPSMGVEDIGKLMDLALASVLDLVSKQGRKLVRKASDVNL